MKVWFTGLGTKAGVSRFRAKLSTLRLDHGLLERCGKIMAGGIIDNIERQQQASGAGLRQNAPSTLERKRRKARPLMSLIDELNRFVRGSGASWAVNVDPAKNDVIIEPTTGELRNLVRWVQMKGYVGWFGISKTTLAALKEMVYQDILDKVNRIR